ncbi:IS66 family insertion sequence element accessory protein TnpB [Sphingobium sp. R-7]|uniref:IS66 family insertion sequence element accessory protein TnpB n=1 Tax=Sphingobium sp. R-7 TaxID=3375449 RepID=UPI00398B359C
MGATLAPGAKVTQVAAQADIRPSQIYRWRHDLLAPQRMVPAVVTGQSSEPTSSPVLVIEVRGATVRVMADAPSSLVTAALRAFRQS